MAKIQSDSFSLQEIVERFGGDIVGDSDVRIRHIATLANAGPGTITFVANERYSRHLDATRASAVIVNPAMRDSTAIPRIVCANPYSYFARVSQFLNPPRAARAGVHATAVIEATATVAADAEIGPLVSIGGGSRIGGGSLIEAGSIIGEQVTVGENVRIHANVTIYDRCVIGNRVILHSGAVIGADGFGIAWTDDRWLKVPQVGRVVIGDDVEVGANTTIDRGAIDDTVIEEGVKLDNLIQIAHNVRIGAHTAIAACAGVAGSASIGRYCRIGGASGIAGHLTIADHVEISTHTLITKSIDKPGVYTGAYPFETNREWRKNAVQLRRLGDLADRVRALEANRDGTQRSKP